MPARSLETCILQFKNSKELNEAFKQFGREAGYLEMLNVMEASLRNGSDKEDLIRDAGKVIFRQAYNNQKLKEFNDIVEKIIKDSPTTEIAFKRVSRMVEQKLKNVDIRRTNFVEDKINIIDAYLKREYGDKYADFKEEFKLLYANPKEFYTKHDTNAERIFLAIERGKADPDEPEIVKAIGEVYRKVYDNVLDDARLIDPTIGKIEGYTGKAWFSGDRVRANKAAFKRAMIENLDEDFKADMMKKNEWSEDDLAESFLEVFARDHLGNPSRDIKTEIASRNMRFKEGGLARVQNEFGMSNGSPTHMAHQYIESMAAKMAYTAEFGYKPKDVIDGVYKNFDKTNISESMQDFKKRAYQVFDLLNDRVVYSSDTVKAIDQIFRNLIDSGLIVNAALRDLFIDGRVGEGMAMAALKGGRKNPVSTYFSGLLYSVNKTIEGIKDREVLEEVLKMYKVRHLKNDFGGGLSIGDFRVDNTAAESILAPIVRYTDWMADKTRIWSGSDALYTVNRVKSIMGLSAEMAMTLRHMKDFSSVDDNFANILSHHGITETDWKFIRDNMQYKRAQIDPDLELIDTDSLLKAAVTPDPGKFHSAEAYKLGVRDKLNGLLTHLSSLEFPEVRIDHLASVGAQPLRGGELGYLGIVGRNLLRFIPIQQAAFDGVTKLQRSMKVKGQVSFYDEGTLGRFMSTTSQEKAALLGRYLIPAIGFLWIKDIVTGHTPRDLSPEMLIDASMESGIAGSVGGYASRAWYAYKTGDATRVFGVPAASAINPLWKSAAAIQDMKITDGEKRQMWKALGQVVFPAPLNIIGIRSVYKEMGESLLGLEPSSWEKRNNERLGRSNYLRSAIRSDGED